MKKALIVLMSIVALFFAPGTTQAADLTDGALGIPWGASPAQARQLMEQNNYAFVEQMVYPKGVPLPMFVYRGLYASYPATVRIEFINNQMVVVAVILWEGKLTETFRDLNGLLTEKYGLLTSNFSVYYEPKPCRGGLRKESYWKNVGAAGLNITLIYYPGLKCPDGDIPESVSVEYKNDGLVEKLKDQSRQNI
ncbi:MAG: hypothetical protein P4N59_32185 [Negativicutes bacterium]|nr:hypothetical protein [Negativicutes bacterium]